MDLTHGPVSPTAPLTTAVIPLMATETWTEVSGAAASHPMSSVTG